jgi:antitoxin MazE
MNSKKKNIKIIQIGNSQGIRLPKLILNKYGFTDSVVIEEKENGIFLTRETDNKMSWEDTFKDMAKENEDWSDLDNTTADGIE